MAREVERGSRGKSGAVSGDGGDRNRPSANPSRRREGSFVAANPFMPGLRVREDGWTAARTRRFLAVLAQSGCVSDAERVAGMSRSEEHTSELQSLMRIAYAVFCLKKKQKSMIYHKLYTQNKI